MGPHPDNLNHPTEAAKAPPHQPQPRREDEPLLRGRARFLADLAAPDALHAVFVRSGYAHGLLRAVDSVAARASPGVVAVLDAKDLSLPDIPEWPREGEAPRPELARPCLARERVRFVGEPVAVVVAESLAAAVDAAGEVVLDIEALPAVTDPLEAMKDGAPLLFPGLRSNVAVELALAAGGAAPVGEVSVTARFHNRRLAPVPLEPNGAFVRLDPDGVLVCHLSCQAPHFVRGAIARALGRAEETVRVVVPAVGGAFGAKGGVYPEQIVTAALAERLGRSVRYVETRSENLVAMTHGRGQVQEITLGAGRDGRILSMSCRTVTELGAYCARGYIPIRTSRRMATGPYRIPQVSGSFLGVLTNTTPTGPYRGAGRPEAAAMLERAIDLLALDLGLDGAEVRRRNLLGPSELPYLAPSGARYDSGDYLAALEAVLAMAGYEPLRRLQEERREEGADRQLGIGLAVFVEVSGIGSEYGAVRVEPGGSVVVTTGSSPHGQGHETVFSGLAARVLGVPVGTVRVVHSDTAAVARGTGTFGSRSGQLGGTAVRLASEEVLRKARELAAELLEASPDDVVRLDDGRFAIAGVPSRALSLGDIATVTAPGGLLAEADFAQEHGTYPYGAHLAVVEVERSTGRVELVRLVAVDDCGVVLDPAIVEGQVHGGLAQGVAQALFEEVGYDALGNPLTTSLADYLMPSAAELCLFETEQLVTPSPCNPLGAKGIGESGTVGGAVAVQNAVLDALAPYGVRHVDMPLLPERVWRALGGARRPEPLGAPGPVRRRSRPPGA